MPRLTEVGASTPVTDSPPLDAWSRTHYILLFYYRASYQALLLLVDCSVLSPRGNIRKESKNYCVRAWETRRMKIYWHWKVACRSVVWPSTLFSSCKLYLHSSLFWTQVLGHFGIKWEGKGEKWLNTSNWRYLLMLAWFAVWIIYWHNFLLVARNVHFMFLTIQTLWLQIHGRPIAIKMIKEVWSQNP